MGACVREIQIGSENWTAADQELEDWLQSHGFDYTMCVDYRMYAKTEDEWQQYVRDVKSYALTCKDVYEFMDLRERVKGLMQEGKSHDLRDENGRLIAILD